MKYSRSLPLLTLCLFFTHIVFSQTAAPDGTIAGVTGSGTKNYIPIWTSSTALGNSSIFQSSGKVGVGTTSPAYALDVAGYVNTSKGYKFGGLTILTSPGGSGFNIAAGYEALLNDQTAGIQNTAVGYQALLNNTTGTLNSAVGFQALYANTTGTYNVGVGDAALDDNTAGTSNTATGVSSLLQNNTGSYNTGDGMFALFANTTGSYNTAVGYAALSSFVGSPITGSNNTVAGAYALYNETSGSGNVAIGYQAAYNVSGGNSNNIEIGNLGQSADNATIRIGTVGTQSSFFAAGVYGASSGSSSAIPVLVDSSGQLVTVSSSRRFKEDIQDMGDASSGLMRLRPVTFRYKKALDDGSKPVQYGLIAEEVAEVYPDLVSRSADGQVQTIKYQLLDPMLLNEVQRQNAEIVSLQERLSKLEAALASVSHAPEAGN